MAGTGISTKEAIAEINALIKSFDDLAASTRNISTNSKKGLKELSESTAQLKNQAALAEQKLAALNARILANSRGANSYAKQMDDLRRKTEAASKAADKYGKDLDALEKKSNKTTSSFGKLTDGIKSLLGAYGIATGVQLFAQLTIEIFKNIRAFESLSFTMKQITIDTVDLASSNTFLINLTKDFGVELFSTANRWVKFLAAARQSNVTLRDTEEIFRSVTKAGAVLGLTTDELSGVYLALEQMLSKGKVTTEELRRQLGERIPGAVGIMATALGVGVDELDKMLKKGEVLSNYALPKFAKALELAYGIENVERIDNIVAAQGRLTTAWQKFTKEVFSSSIYKDAMQYISDVIEKITYKQGSDAYKSEVDVAKESARFEKYLDDMAKMRYNKQRQNGPVYDELTKNLEAAKNKLLLSQASGLGDEETKIRQKTYDDLLALSIKAEKKLQEEKTALAKEFLPKYYSYFKQAELNYKGGEDGIRLTIDPKDPDRIRKEYDEALAKLLVLRKHAESEKEIIKKANEDDEDGDGDKKPKQPKYYDLKAIEDYENKVKIATLRLQKEKNDALLEANVLYGQDLVAILNDNAAVELEIAKIQFNEVKRLAEKELADRLAATKEKQKDGYVLTFDPKVEEKEATELKDKKILEAEKILQAKLLEIKVNARQKILDNEEKIKQEYLSNINEIYDYEVIALKEAYEKTGKTKEDKEDLDKKLFLLQANRVNELIDAQIAYNNALMANNDLTVIQIDLLKKQNAELLASKVTIGDIETEDLKEKGEQLIEILETISEFSEAISELVVAVFERKIQKIDEEIQAEKDKYAKLIELAKNNNEEQVRLQKERDLKIEALEKKKAKEKRKQAIAEKANALVQVAINTAIGISKAVAEFPLTGGMPWTAIVAALGAIQAATIIAQPIPKYKKGLKKANKDHVGQINDGGQQEYLERDGSIFSTTEKDAIIQIKKGDTIHKSYEAMIASRQLRSNDSFKQTIVVNNNNEDLKSDIIDGIAKGFKKVKIQANINYDADWANYKKNTL